MTILKLGEEDEKNKRMPLSGSNANRYVVPWLMGRGRIFEKALMAENLWL